jgi:dTDP-glucose 4,6-dehydratase
MLKRILITGGCGFIGHHFVEHFLKNTDWEIVVWDKLTYASSGFDRLRDINVFDEKRVKIIGVDISKEIPEGVIKETGKVDYIFHLAAETHVDRSIANPIPFIESNVYGTYYMLQYARKLDNLNKFFYFSTDEVFGPAPEGVEYGEYNGLKPSNPYSATKAGGEMLCWAWINTYKLPVVITRTMNVFGERQHPEKFIPKVIRAVLKGEKVYIHADPTKTKPGSRFWIHTRNVADAYLFLVENGEIGEVYHIVGEKEVNNLELAQFIAKVIGKPLIYELVDFHSSRPGHDLRYALADNNLRNLGWKQPKTFEESLEKTIKWTLEHPQWLFLEGS